jgi:Phosphate acetyl/butaryl transferase/Sigma-70 factor, region 1.2
LEDLIMARAAAVPILTAEPGLTHYLEEIRRFPMLEREEEYMLAKRWREHGDRDAAHKLVTSHLRLVTKIARDYRGALCKMAERGQITGGILDGPLAFDNAIDLEAARIKGIKSEVAGRAQILVVPDLEAGNMLLNDFPEGQLDTARIAGVEEHELHAERARGGLHLSALGLGKPMPGEPQQGSTGIRGC